MEISENLENEDLFTARLQLFFNFTALTTSIHHTFRYSKFLILHLRKKFKNMTV